MSFLARLRRSSLAGRRFRPAVESLETRQVLSAVLQVHQGVPTALYQTIQSAVNAAHAGDEIEVFTGTYREAVTVTKPGLTIEAAPGAQAVVQNPGAAQTGFTVQAAGNGTLAGFTLRDITVRGFAVNGVFLAGVTNFVLDHDTAVNNATYGFFPVQSGNGVITACTASCSNDTGIYVGQSHNILVQGNEAYDNVNGIEIENSTAVTVQLNSVHNNTVGMLVDLLPGFPLAFERSSQNVIANNLVFLNNRPNNADHADIASVEPPGTGIAVIGGDHTLIQGNVVFGNAFAGIALLSGMDLLALAAAAGISVPAYPPNVDPDPDFTLIQGNVVVGNGFVSPVPSGFPTPADLLWTGHGQHNHWVQNVFGTISSPVPLP
jgi:parallel beta-helix repeat protein